MRCPVVLPFITKQANVLFNFLVLVLYFAVTLWMVGNSEASFNIKALVEGSHGNKQQTAGCNQRIFSLEFCGGRIYWSSECQQHPWL
jgi:membrane protein required for beta-lactamase induction